MGPQLVSTTQAAVDREVTVIEVGTLQRPFRRNPVGLDQVIVGLHGATKVQVSLRKQLALKVGDLALTRHISLSLHRSSNGPKPRSIWVLRGSNVLQHATNDRQAIHATSKLTTLLLNVLESLFSGIHVALGFPGLVSGLNQLLSNGFGKFKLLPAGISHRFRVHAFININLR